MSEWKPIETAPRNGTEFLAFDSRTRKFDVCQMREWGQQPHEQWEATPVQVDSEYGPCVDDFGYRPEDITHWMPLPALPQEQEQDGWRYPLRNDSHQKAMLSFTNPTT